MRLDHVAYRVKDRLKTAQFVIDAMGYTIQTEFEPIFSDGTSQGVKCIALEPPEKFKTENNVKWTGFTWNYIYENPGAGIRQEYHLPPEIFISDGPPESIVGKWVAERGDIGGVHHFAYQVEDVQKIMDEWKSKGYAEFLSDKPLTCPGLTQVFSKPSLLTGTIIEFIAREGHGFCAESVAALMESTK